MVGTQWRAGPSERRARLVNGVALALALGWVALIFTTLTPSVQDFDQYRQAAANVLAAGDPYLTTPEPGGGRAGGAPFPYPPLLAYLLLPFGLLASLPALQLWLAAQAAMLAGVLALALRLSGSALARRYWGVAALALVFVPPTRLSLQLGQVSIPLTLLALLALALAERRPRASGAALALGALIKLYPALLALFFLRHGPRRAAWWAAASGALIVAAELAAHGWLPFATYVRKVLLGGFYPYAAEFNVSFVGLWQRLLAPSAFAAPAADAPQLAWALSAACAAGALALCWWAGSGPAPADRAALYATYLCAMLLISPVNGYYNLVALVLPALVALRRAELGRGRGRGALLLSLALVSLPPGWSGATPLYEALHTGWGILALSPALYGLVILFILMARMAREGAPDGPHAAGAP